MAIGLEGGCRVSLLREGTCKEHGTVRAWPHAGRATGATAISLRVLELAPGRSPALGGAACDEVLYLLEGAGTLLLDGASYSIGPDTGFYVWPGARFEIENPGPLPMTLVSSRCPDPDQGAQPAMPAALEKARPSPVVRLSERASEITGDRWYRVLVDGNVGSAQVTQFVGAIPPGRAPDHYHEYEEVLCILEGRGRMWAGASSTPIARGSCIFLPRRQVHCVENTGDTELRLLGVFYPAGSPAVRYSG
jgi:mannose-6-phosphate isomerase-like protein (cupin superfamily)